MLKSEAPQTSEPYQGTQQVERGSGRSRRRGRPARRELRQRRLSSLLRRVRLRLARFFTQESAPHWIRPAVFKPLNSRLLPRSDDSAVGPRLKGYLPRARLRGGPRGLLRPTRAQETHAKWTSRTNGHQMGLGCLRCAFATQSCSRFIGELPPPRRPVSAWLSIRASNMCPST